jgi:hypothetical protein
VHPSLPSSSLSARLISLGLAAAFLAAPGCAGNSNLPTAPNVANPSGSTLFSVEIEAPRKSLAIGGQLELFAQGKDDRDTPIDVTPTWKSSDTRTATVDASGRVTGLKSGSVTITATTKSPPREATIQLTVLTAGQAPPPDDLIGGDDLGGNDLIGGELGGLPGTDFPDQSGGGAAPTGVTLAIYPEVPRVAPGERIRLVALQTQGGREVPSAAVWRTSDPSVATVDEGGVVTAVAAGNVTIRAASLSYPALNRVVNLQVIAPKPPTAISGIRIKPSRVAMNVGETFWLLAEVPTWDGAFDPQIRWESGNPDIVTVSETGQVTAVGPGSTVITAVAAGYTKGDLSAVVPVEVRNATVGR